MKTKPKAILAYGAPQRAKKEFMIENANNALYLALHTHKGLAWHSGILSMSLL